MERVDFEQRFTGLIGEDYNKIHRLINPNGILMGSVIATQIRDVEEAKAQPVRGFEIGCGTGMSTYVLLTETKEAQFRAIDSEKSMLKQAETVLKEWENSERLELVHADALAALREEKDESLDVVASVYAIHNFFDDYRKDVLTEVKRVLVPGGLFLNGDRYALDDSWENTRLVSRELSGWFDALVDEGRVDLIKTWVVHTLEDESPRRIMREGVARERFEDLGFAEIKTLFRNGADAVMHAKKPA